MIDIIANAKVNLFLEITGKISNGYHTVDTIMQSVSLFDELKIELLPKTDGIKIICDEFGIPCDERNIAYKTAKTFLDITEADCGVSISIKKQIPSEAGMGGGSADGAAVLYGLNELCGNPLSSNQLIELAASKGADIPFCIYGGTARLVGIGTELFQTYDTPDLNLVIAKPMKGISTPAAYSMLDRIHGNFENHISFKPDPSDLIAHMYNRFEETLDELCPESMTLINELRQRAGHALLSGSGTAVFAVAESSAHADALVKYINENYPNCFVTKASTASRGCIIV